MRYFDDFGNELNENEIDLSLGYLTEGTAIKVDAEQINNETKWAWSDDDYEIVQYYHLYPEKSSIPTSEERIAAIEAALLELMGVTVDG